MRRAAPDNFLRSAAVAAALLVGFADETAQAQQQATQQIPLPAGTASADSSEQTTSGEKTWLLKIESQPVYTDAVTTGRQQVTGGRLKATQWQVPLAASLSLRPNDYWLMEFGARGSYVDFSQRNANIRGEYKGWTDTSLSGTATYYGFDGFQPFLSLNANLPTGTTRLSSRQNNARPDPDIFQIPGFGEGLNIGPTIGVNIPITSTVTASFGLGHTFRGRFDRNGIGAGGTERLDPGDVTTINASLGYTEGRVSLLAQASYSFEGKTSLSGSPFYEAGDRIKITGSAGYAWTDALSSQGSVSYTHYNRNKILSPPAPGIFGLEVSNSNNDIVNASFDTTYKAGAFAVGPSLGYMYRMKNGYDPVSLQYVPAKSSYSLGGVAQYQATERSTVTLRVQRQWVKVDDMPGTAPITPTLRSRIWTASIGGSIQF